MSQVQRVTREALTEVRETVQGYRRLAFADALEGARAALSAAGIDCRVERATTELPDDVERPRVGRARVGDERRPPQRRPYLRDHALDRCDRRRVAGRGRRRRKHTSQRDGTGLAGLAERARRLHGTVEAGPRPSGGFRLRLTLPLRAA